MKENNNKGFTLIEILVAIVALALVVVPLLQGFVTTAKLNTKSREKMMATNVAQAHMEQYSGLTIEEIDKEIKMLNGTYDSTVGFVESGEHKYTYPIAGYSHNGETYDIKVSIDADAYHAEREIAEGVTVPGINDTGFSEVTSIDVTQDGIFSESTAVLDEAIDVFFARNLSSTLEKLTPGSENVFRGMLERTIAILVEEKLDGTGETYTDVKLKFIYKYQGDKYLSDSDKIYEKSITIFSNQHEEADKRKPLRNVYLMFRPYYDSTFSDIIEIKNQNNKDINVYLIKQKTISDDVYLNDEERNYQASVRVEESAIGSDGKAHAKIFTNLGYYYSKEDDKSTTIDERNMVDVEGYTQVYYAYITGGAMHTDKIATDYFIPEYKEDRMYLLKVEVYKSGAAGNGFKEEDKLAELSN